MAHYNIDSQGATLTNVFKVEPEDHAQAAKLQGHIYGMIPDGKTTHSFDKTGKIILKTTLKIDEPSLAEITHFYHQCDVIAGMVFLKPGPTKKDADEGQEGMDWGGADPTPALNEPVENLDAGEEPKAIGDGLNNAVEVEDPSGDPDFDTGDSDELEPDDSPLTDDSDE